MAIARRPISSIARVALRDVIFRRRSAELWGYRLLSVQAIRHRHADLSLSIPRYSPSLPLDCARRFRGHVVDDTIDALDLVDDAGCHVSDEFHLERVEIGRHTVCRGYRAQCHDIVVGAKVSHHAHAAHRQQHRKGLPDVVIEPRAPDLFDEDLVGKPQDVELLARDLARATDRKTRARARTSSLNSSRKGSTSFMFIRSGKPPTLWCDLMVTDGPPVNETLSITSG